jgi:hypothetical protein
MKPLQITIKSAKGLKGIRGEASNPIVIISAVSEMGAEFEQEYQRLSSSTTGSSSWAVSADWKDEELILPGITSNSNLVLTVVDYGEDGHLTFMGQGLVEMDDAKWSAPTTHTLELEEPVHVPQDGSGKAMGIDCGDANGEWKYCGGTLDITLTPFDPTYAMCGEIQKTGGDRYTSVWKSRWILLKDSTLYYYSFYGDPKPKYTIDLTQAKSVEHPDRVLEMVNIEMPDKTWQLKAPDILLGGEWWWKLRQASGQKGESKKGDGVALADSEHASKKTRRVVSTL